MLYLGYMNYTHCISVMLLITKLHTKLKISTFGIPRVTSGVKGS